MQRRFFLTFALALGMACLTGPTLARAQFTWKLVKFEGRDYVPLETIAQFYQLQGDLRLVDRRFSLSNQRARVEIVDGDPRQILINGVRQWCSFPVVMQGNQAYVSRFDLAKTLDPAIRPTAVPEVRPFHTIVLDAGHGGVDRGARSVTGFEKDYTLDVIRDIKKQLETAGFRVRLTREDDTFIPLEERAARANQENDAIFVSVHFNFSDGSGAVTANGLEVYAMTPRGAGSTGDAVPMLDVLKDCPGNAVDNASLVLATSVQHSLLGHITQGDRGVKRARFAVLKLCKLPAVLVEGGFLSNPNESQRINDAAWRHQLAESIVAGVQSYSRLAEQHVPPRLLADYRLEQLPTAGRMVNPDTVVPAGPATPAVLPASNEFIAQPPPNAPPPPPAAASPASGAATTTRPESSDIPLG
ncbi:MAG: N-acetylmuramoyl-L-alanine amidase [Verrucomicrobia bacterium]|nr:N-acetylmuramoyl-L-alanine amidase [Verrucomicrobiota bacterium]MBV9659055.1 N-acetylmuramoyl-L-alanine amidase [Verrucomicrobiota bacterium]